LAARQALRGERRAIDRVDRDGGRIEPSRHVPTCSSSKIPGASSLRPSPIRTRPLQIDEAEHPAHRVGGGAVGLVLVALAEILPGRERGVLGRAHKIEIDDAFGSWRMGGMAYDTELRRSVPGNTLAGVYANQLVIANW